MKLICTIRITSKRQQYRIYYSVVITYRVLIKIYFTHSIKNWLEQISVSEEMELNSKNIYTTGYNLQLLNSLILLVTYFAR